MWSSSTTHVHRMRLAMRGRRAWLVVTLAFLLGAGGVLVAAKLLSAPRATSVDLIQLESPTERSHEGKKSDGGKKREEKRKKGGGGPSGDTEEPSSGGAPAVPPAPPAPAGGDDDDDGDDDTDDGGGEDSDD